MLLNTIFLVYGVVIEYKDNKRTKAIKAAKLKYEEAMKVMEEKKLQEIQEKNSKS